MTDRKEQRIADRIRDTPPDCPFPHKAKYTGKQAREELARSWVPTMEAYRCPSGRHWHLGRQVAT